MLEDKFHNFILILELFLLMKELRMISRPTCFLHVLLPKFKWKNGADSFMQGCSLLHFKKKLYLYRQFPNT